MRVLLACLHFGLLRNFESAVEELVKRGHHVVLAAEEADGFGGDTLASTLAGRLSNVTIASIPPANDDPSIDLGRRLRLVLDNFRFHGDAFAEFGKLRERMVERLPYFAQQVNLARIPGVRGALSHVERALPINEGHRAWLRSMAPDVVLLSSLTHLRSAQPALLRTAIDEHIPTIACVYSWDHLSSKSHIIDVPDRVMVWNEAQKEEAVRLHGLPADRITTTGAQCYDQWFESGPARDRATFCAATGLDPSRPYVLYTCSALTPSPNEPAFVMDWIARLRHSPDPTLRDVGVLLRPHPERVHEWQGVDHTRFGNVAFRPRTGTVDDARRDYLDALHHSAAVVGIVTSAFLEAAIIGRPVLTPMLPAFAPHQWGTQHFRYLLEVEEGLPIVGRTLDEHLQQLASVLAGNVDWKARQERFLATFVRAGAIARPSTPVFVDTVEQVASAPAQGFRRRAGPVGRALAPLALRVATSRRVRPWILDDTERANFERKLWEDENRRAKEQVRDVRYEEKDRLRAAREERWQQKRAEKAALKRERQREKARQRRGKRLLTFPKRVLARVGRVLHRT